MDCRTGWRVMSRKPSTREVTQSLLESSLLAARLPTGYPHSVDVGTLRFRSVLGVVQLFGPWELQSERATAIGAKDLKVVPLVFRSTCGVLAHADDLEVLGLLGFGVDRCQRADVGILGGARRC